MGLFKWLLQEFLVQFKKDLEDVKLRQTTLENKMNKDVQDLKTKFDADIAAINANLANVSADIANLNQQIQDLNTKLQGADMITQEDKDALAAIASASDGLVTSTKALADQTPDVPPTPPTL